MNRLFRFLALACLLALDVAPVSARCVGAVISDGSGREPSCASDHIEIPEGRGRTWHVGPNQELKSIGDVPWYDLKAGDTVFVHHRSEPYRERILISGRGTQEQWIRVLGVPGPNGELPVISGDRATSRNLRFRWDKPDLVEWLGVVLVAVGPGTEANPGPKPPAYIEIANLQVQDGFSTYRFQAADGTWLKYNGFAACIYARSVDHILVRNNVLTNCGQGFYNWTGDGATDTWWAALQYATVLSGNHFFNNGNPKSYLEHQVYTESDGVTIEYNRFGKQRPGALGSQIKDRSAGTVIRYNWIDQALAGWDLDLVEPEESWLSLGSKPQYRQTFVYGNVIVSKGVAYPNLIHWNEDHQARRGRATFPDARLFFYNNTVVIFSGRSGSPPYSLFNGTWGGYDCPEMEIPGIIEMRNNVIAVLHEGFWRRPPLRLGYCRKEKIVLGTNWISPDTLRDENVTGWNNTLKTTVDDPGFAAPDDFTLKPGTAAAAAAGETFPEMTHNRLGRSFVPTHRFVGILRLEPRSKTLSLGAH